MKGIDQRERRLLLHTVLVFSASLIAPAVAGERSLAAGDCPSQSAGEPVKLAEAVSGDVLRLRDGRIIRLAGIDAARGSIDGAAGNALAAAARDRAAGVAASDAGLRLRKDLPNADRHGRIHGEIILPDGQSLAAALLAEGLARVHPFVEETICLEPLLDAERAARKMQAGVWAGHEYAIWQADDASLKGQNGLYELVEGRVVSVGARSRFTFIDFGRDWGRDFTVMLTASLAADLAKAASPVASLVHHRVRVRGVIEAGSRPLMRVETGGQIELLDGD
jgi:endonuclease YncB( thermonuclease family)